MKPLLSLSFWAVLAAAPFQATCPSFFLFLTYNPNNNRSPQQKRSNAIFFLFKNPTIPLLFPAFFPSLPLSLLSSQELLQNSHDLLERGQPGVELLVHTLAVLAQLGVEVGAVRGGAHGGAENRLDDERVVGFEGVAVGGAEGLGQLGFGVRQVGAQGLRGEVEASGGGVLVGLRL